jgi:hypothetical protein
VTVKNSDDTMVQLKGDDISPDQVSDRIKKPQGKEMPAAADAKGKGSQGAGKQRRNRPVDVKERKKEKPSS